MATKSERKTVIDPSVAELLGNLQDKSNERRLPTAERKKRARQRAKLSSRNRIMLDLPEDVQASLAVAAESLGCPMSQVAAALLLAILKDQDWKIWRIALSHYLVPSKSPRFDFVLDLDKLRELLSQGTPLVEK